MKPTHVGKQGYVRGIEYYLVDGLYYIMTVDGRLIRSGLNDIEERDSLIKEITL